ncbi:hypothetical protein GYB61_04010 [bacterium]|nr:hypothetical protein [bacterium]
MLRKSTIFMLLVVVAITAGTYFAMEKFFGGEKVEETDDGPTAEEVFSSNASSGLTASGSTMSSEERALRSAARAAAEGAAREAAEAAAQAALDGETYTPNSTSAANDADLEAVARAAAITEARRVAAETARKVIEDQLG